MDRAANQRHRLNRAFNLARTSVPEAIDLDRLAKFACLSKFHFCRIFREHYKESPLEYLWRIRLERAARRLVFGPETPITTIALESGFSSSQTFSQAFRKRYRTSPREFRSANLWNLDRFSRMQYWLHTIHGVDPIKPTRETADLPVRIEQRPEYRIAYIRHLGPYGDADGGISKTFNKMRSWIIENDRWRPNTAGIGLCPDSPSITPANLSTYDVGITVPSHVTEDNTVSIQTIPAGTYAVLKLRSQEQVLGHWQWLTSVWLPSSGLRYTPLYSYEYIPVGNEMPLGNERGVELCLRIQYPG